MKEFNFFRINDEKSLATSDDEKLKILELFERAVKDYVDVGLWLEFCQFFIGTPDGLTKVSSGASLVKLFHSGWVR